MYKSFFKRLLDILFSLILSPFVLLITIIFGVWVALDDGFPIFYNAERRGKNGSVFKMFKLRSMKNNSPDLRGADGSTLNSATDPRLTRSGRVIHKLSVDEIPQIFNVLIGNMSFIGPRPSLVSMDYDQLDAPRKKRLEVLPGITGYSQAFFRNSISQEEKIEKDCWYVDHVSFILDVKIVLKTIQSVLLRKNIYNSKKEQ